VRQFECRAGIPGWHGVIPSEAVLQAERGISRALPQEFCFHARFLAPLVKARGFGMTPPPQGRETRTETLFELARPCLIGLSPV